MKRQEGVTLIALAVTIIVMLILAGVSISTLTGNSGISKNAENARLQNELGSIIEKINLAISESFMNDVNVDKMKVLIDKGYIIENKDKNYDYVDASTVLVMSGEQFARSDTKTIFKRSFATLLEDFFLKKSANPITIHLLSF